MPESVSSGIATVNGIDMYHAIYGDADGTPILMIHGGLAHADVWSAQVADLMADYKVIVADTRGHGRSTNDGSDYSYGLLSADYLALLDHLGVEKVHLVGALLHGSDNSRKPKLAASMAGGHPVLCLPASGAQDHLHHQRHRKPEPGDPENHQNPWQLSNRCRRHQADLSGHPQFRKGGSLRQRMGCRPKPVRYSLPRTVQQMTRFNCMG